MCSSDTNPHPTIPTLIFVISRLPPWSSQYGQDVYSQIGHTATGTACAGRARTASIIDFNCLPSPGIYRSLGSRLIGPTDAPLGILKITTKSGPGQNCLWRLMRRAPFYQPVETVEKMPDRRPVSFVAKQRLLARKSLRLKRSDRHTTGCWPNTKPPIELPIRYKKPGLWSLCQIVPQPARIRVFVLRFIVLGHGSDLLSHAIAREIVAYVGLDCLCRCDIGVAASFVAVLELGKPAPIKRARQLRVEPKC
jgi:hypothetical protein